MGKSSSPSVNIPNPPNPKQTLKQGANFITNQLLPEFLEKEYGFRQQYDPLYIQHQQGLQDKFGPTQYRQMLDALKALDPTGYALREQTGHAISGDLAAGTHLTADQSQDLEQQIRRTQSRTGNAYGQAPVQAEAFGKGMAGLQLYQQRLNNAMQFQNSATPESWASLIPPVNADRQAAYANPDTAFQYLNAVNAAYGAQVQAMLGNAAASSGGSNPWMSALSGAMSGASTGMMFGPYGAGIGAVIGGLGGGLSSAFSDKRAKTHIKPVGKVKGVKMYEYAYKGKPGVKMIGAMAQDVKKTNPDAVVTDPATGLMKVNYAKLGLPLPTPLS